jgi:Zn-dependent protease
MAIVNLMPCYPLDGGRVLSALFSKKFGEDKAHKITKTLGAGFSLVFFMVFIITLKKEPNLSAFMMGTFTLVGALSMKKENRYVKIYTAISTEKLLRGMAYNKIAIDINATIKTLFLSLDQNAINEVAVFSKGEFYKVLYQKDINALLEKGAFKEKISKYL